MSTPFKENIFTSSAVIVVIPLNPLKIETIELNKRGLNNEARH